MHPIGAVQLAIRAHDLIVVKEPPYRHGDIHANSRMAFAEDKTIPIRLCDVPWIDI
jgi:hypothetical protein